MKKINPSIRFISTSSCWRSSEHHQLKKIERHLIQIDTLLNQLQCTWCSLNFISSLLLRSLRFILFRSFYLKRKNKKKMKENSLADEDAIKHCSLEKLPNEFTVSIWSFHFFLKWICYSLSLTLIAVCIQRNIWASGPNCLEFNSRTKKKCKILLPFCRFLLNERRSETNQHKKNLERKLKFRPISKSDLFELRWNRFDSLIETDYCIELKWNEIALLSFETWSWSRLCIQLSIKINVRICECIKIDDEIGHTYLQRC